MKWFKQNWPVKIVALFLAVALWLYTSGEISEQRVFEPMDLDAGMVQNLPDDVVVRDMQPQSIQLVLEGPKGLLDDLDPDDLHPRLEVSALGVTEGRQTYEITSRLFGLPPEVRVVQPREPLRLELAEVERQQLPVAVPDVVDLPEGIAGTPEVVVDLSQVWVKGPRDILQTMHEQGRAIRFEPISLATLDALHDQRSLKVSLQPQELPGITVIDDVHATVLVRPRRATTTLVLPLLVQARPETLIDYRFDNLPERVTAQIVGPSTLIETVSPEDVRAAVVIPDQPEAGPLNGLRVRFSTDMRGLSFEPQTINGVQVIPEPRAP